MNPLAYLEMAETESLHWWFSGRRAILSKIIENLDLPENARILEVGCGTGGNLQMLAGFGVVSALEMNEEAREIALKKADHLYDIRAGYCPDAIPFDGQCFDLICMFDVLEHIEQDIETLIALKPLLSEQGRILITVPAYQWLWGAHDIYLHHKRRYNQKELHKKTLSAGLQPIKISYFNTFLFPVAAMVRLKEKIFKSSSACGTAIPRKSLNNVFKCIFSAEKFLLNNINLPFGFSIVGVFQSK